MAMPWFRLYHEWDSDPKVQIMPEVMQRRLIMLFCARCKCDGKVTFRETETAFHWRVSMAELAETKALFIEQGFIDEQWNVLHWEVRQFLSDSSRERTRRYRERLKQGGASSKRHGDATVTGQYTDTEQIQKQRKKKTCAAASATPAHDDHGEPLILPLVTGEEWNVPVEDCLAWVKAFPGVNVLTELLKMRAWLDANPKNQKTPGGVRRFVVSWLSRAQDSARPEGNGNGYGNRGHARTNGNIEAARRAAADIASEDAGWAGGSAPGEC